MCPGKPDRRREEVHGSRQGLDGNQGGHLRAHLASQKCPGSFSRCCAKEVPSPGQQFCGKCTNRGPARSHTKVVVRVLKSHLKNVGHGNHVRMGHANGARKKQTMLRDLHDIRQDSPIARRKHTCASCPAEAQNYCYPPSGKRGQRLPYQQYKT